ncbi:30S ribosomal protein S15 [Cesiribacter sp. SM1]|uniref:30S ribosomal protein S15 n=1 Tax=Cesiribacter sp. SM1 TaxID=2861196 RepID=UPI001CD4FEE5|nr:30S ribosomal protein S15 [Cesiribacter sp. SM1]
MYLTTEKKQELFENHGRLRAKSDTGSAESQIALFSYRINHLTEHLKQHKHDFSTRLGLLKLVGKRRRLLNYLHDRDIERYRAILAELNLRK